MRAPRALPGGRLDAQDDGPSEAKLRLKPMGAEADLRY